MEDHAVKVKRCTIAIKVAMALVIVIEVMAILRTNTFDFGSIAMAIGLLCLLRGLLLSPFMLSKPVKMWFKQNIGFHADSGKYFGLAFLFILVGLVRYV